MKRVLHLVGRMDVGGAESRLLDLLRHSSPEKVRFTFGCFGGEPGRLAEQVTTAGGEFVFLGDAAKPLTLRRELIRLLRSGRFDVLHTHLHFFSGLCVEAAFRAGVPSRIVHIRVTDDARVGSIARRLYRQAMRSLVQRYATDIVDVSQAAMLSFCGNTWQHDRRARVIHNGFDFERFRRSGAAREVRREFHIPSGAAVAIHVGRFQPQKNHAAMLDAATRLQAAGRDVHWVFVGDGPLRPSCEAAWTAAGLRERAHFTGVRSDIPRLLEGADVFVFPSRFEGLPGAVIEALAAGLPVVASDIATVREIAEVCGGIALCPLDAPREMSHAIQSAIAGQWAHPLREAELRAAFCMPAYLSRMSELYDCRDAFSYPAHGTPVPRSGTWHHA